MDHRRDSDHEKVERSEYLGVNGVAVHLMADGEVVVGHVRMEEGETAQRHAPASFGKSGAGVPEAEMPVVNPRQLAQKRHDDQGHQILRQLPEEQ